MSGSQSLAVEKLSVPGRFDRVAARYDLLNRMNPGYVKHLELSAARLRLEDDARILDLCCGTGLSTAALRKVYPRSTIVGLDASAGMLEAARAKSGLSDVTWVHGDAMDPEAAGVQGPFDGILMAYGIRNVPDADACLRRLRGMLADGGTICLHEYSVRGSRWSRAVWNAVTLGVIIPLGLLLTGTTTIFRYLRRSVLAFDTVGELEARLARADFSDVRTRAMPGWQRGVVHSFLATRSD